MSTIDELQCRLKQIRIEIEEARCRLPAHSVKPAQMMALFDLEDERETIVNRLKSMGQEPQKDAPCR